MSLYMLDTDICAFILRGPSPSLAHRMRAVPLEVQVISVITLTELLYGVGVSSKPGQNRGALEAFARHVSVLDWTEAAAEHYADIRVHLQKRSQMIGANDLLIAAHARQAQATLVTGNEREFLRVPGLDVENWNAAR